MERQRWWKKDAHAHNPPCLAPSSPRCPTGRRSLALSKALVLDILRGQAYNFQQLIYRINVEGLGPGARCRSMPLFLVSDRRLPGLSVSGSSRASLGFTAPPGTPRASVGWRFCFWQRCLGTHLGSVTSETPLTLPWDRCLVRLGCPLPRCRKWSFGASLGPRPPGTHPLSVTSVTSL